MKKKFGCVIGLVLLTILAGCESKQPVSKPVENPTPKAVASPAAPSPAPSASALPIASDTPRPAAGATLDDSVDMAQRMIDATSRGDFSAAAADFDQPMQNALTQDQLKALWGQLIAQNGPFQKRLNSKVVKVQGMDAVFVNCQFEKQTIALQVTIKDGKVSGFRLRDKF